MTNNKKNQPIYKDRAGRFQISIWKQERIIKDDTMQLDRVVYSTKACIQYSQFHESSNSWENQRIWCYANDLRNLMTVLTRMGELDFDTPEES